MLEGLDDINWRKQWGPVHLNQNLPQYIRNLLSDNIAERREAQWFVKLEISKDDRIFPATPAVIPFLIELLASPDTPDPEILLQMLHTVARNCSAPLSQSLHISDVIIADSLTSYQLISAAYPLFLTCLKHPSAEVRQATVRLLLELREHSTETRQMLAKFIPGETNPVVKATALEGLSGVVSRWFRGEDRSQKAVYLKLIAAYLSPEHDRLVRLAAAGAWPAAARASFYGGPPDLPKMVLPLLLEAISSPLDTFAYRDFPLLEDDLKFINDYVLYARISWTGVERAAGALHSPLLSTLQTHYLAREMLERVFERHTTVLPAPDEPPYWRWHYFGGWIDYAHTPNAIRYRIVRQPETTPKSAFYSPDDRKYRPGGRLNEWQQKVIRAIVECDAFWQIRSNLFSFFYGLPDDREALRHLAENLPV